MINWGSERESEEILEQDTDAEIQLTFLQQSDSSYYLKNYKITKWYNEKGKTSIRICSSNKVTQLLAAKGAAKSYNTLIEFCKQLMPNI